MHYEKKKKKCIMKKKKKNVCNNQNSLERTTTELKKVNISIIKYPLFFSFSENTV